MIGLSRPFNTGREKEKYLEVRAEILYNNTIYLTIGGAGPIETIWTGCG